MELSLHGSQISLATRYKPQQPSVQYPAVQNDPAASNYNKHSRAPRRRPESANVFGGGASSIANRYVSSSSSAFSGSKDAQHRHHRPVSADNHRLHHSYASNQLRSVVVAGQRRKGGPVVKADTTKYASDEAYHHHSSSSNILNDLLAESIERSSKPSRPAISSKSLGQQIKAKASMANETDDDNESSIEEDLQDISSETNDEDLRWRATKPDMSSSLMKPLKVRQHSAGLSNTGETGKKYVTFSKQDVVLKTPATARKEPETKPDLPGRVSFNTSDVFALEISDDGDDEMNFDKFKSSRSPDDAISRESSATSIKYEIERNTNDVSSTKDLTSAHHSTDVENACCSLKCNSLLETSSAKTSSRERFPDFAPSIEHSKSDYENDNSDRIIADYKREIEKLNREHNQSTITASVDNAVTAFEQDLSHVSEESSENGNRSLGEKCQNDDPVISEIITNAWNNHQSNKQTSSEHKLYTKSAMFGITDSEKKVLNGSGERKPNANESNDVKAAQNDFESAQDSSTTVIGNYLKTKDPKPPASQIQSKKVFNIINPSKLARINNGVKGSVKSPAILTTTKSVAKPAVKRVVSAQLKSTSEDNRLNDFQMEKVESWMSIHEFSKQPETLQPETNAGGETLSNRGDTLNLPENAYNQSWRDTPCSKTDDEGMFSFDDQLEGEESTYDDIVSVIKEIEEEKSHDLEATVCGKNVPKTIQNTTSNQQHQSANETPDKMKEILSYLDQVESSCEQTMHDTYSGKIPDSFRSEIEFAVEPDIIGDMPKMVDLLMLPNQQLARRVIALSLRANELSSAIQLSREHMASVRTEKNKSVRAEKQTAAVRMADQKRHFESVVQRHQGFIEQLLKDKQSLGDKVTALIRRSDSQNQAWQHKLETEIARVKETALAAEKIRRERWVRENTKKIKELTVKGLEQEINAMTCAHQKEIAELKRLHQQDLLDAVEEVRLKHEQLECGIRESYAQDRETSIEKERNAIRERFERQIESEQRSFDEQKARLQAAFSAEKKRWAAAMQEKEFEFERRKIELVEEKRDEVYHLKGEHSEKLGAIEMKHQAYQKMIQDQFESDFAIWKREHEATSSLKQVERENAIRLECRLERDRQIDAIVAKVDAEALQGQSNFDAKLCRIREKHESELKELERSERNYREKNAELRTKLSESEANRENAQASLKQLDIQLQYTQQLYDDLLAEKETQKAAARQEVDAEVAALRTDRDAEIERIYARVQTAVEKKDAAIEVLHKDSDALKERCIKLEAIVRQQRQDYFVK